MTGKQRDRTHARLSAHESLGVLQAFVLGCQIGYFVDAEAHVHVQKELIRLINSCATSRACAIREEADRGRHFPAKEASGAGRQLPSPNLDSARLPTRKSCCSR